MDIFAALSVHAPTPLQLTSSLPCHNVHSAVHWPYAAATSEHNLWLLGNSVPPAVFHPASSSSTQALKFHEPTLGFTVSFKRSTNHSSYMRAAALIA
jgi:hypothetical protein